jgi:hypothetical protein
MEAIQGMEATREAVVVIEAVDVLGRSSNLTRLQRKRQ